MRKPNIVLIVMDAVRAQNMSLYGYEKESTPYLKKISEKCMIYKNAIASSFWTLPSVGSLFTGTFASKHGLIKSGHVLHKKFITMSEMLQNHGYKTIGLCPNPYVSKFSGLNRGFDLFYDHFNTSFQSYIIKYITKIRAQKHDKEMGKIVQKDLLQKKRFLNLMSENYRRSSSLKKAYWMFAGLFDKYARVTNNQLFNMLERINNQPFFFYIHFNEAHTPYILPMSYRDKFLTQALDTKPWNVNQDYFKYYSGAKKMTKEHFDTLKALYDGAINYLDMRVFEIYSFLQKKGLLDNTMIIITSDHGESIGEHDIMFHQFCLYDTLIKIPLIIKYPIDLDISGEDVRMVQNVDIYPTIIDILGIGNKKLLNQIQGNSLINSTIINRDFSYAISELIEPFGLRMQSLKNRLKKYDRNLICIRTDRKKYIYATNNKNEYYDLKKDPYETDNLINIKNEDIKELRTKLNPWLENFLLSINKIKIEENQKINDIYESRIKQQLKKLGYI